MTSSHYTSIPIILSKQETGDLIILDTDHISNAPINTLQTLVYLNTQIVTQIADYCSRNQVSDHLPISITVTPLLPLTRGIK